MTSDLPGITLDRNGTVTIAQEAEMRLYILPGSQTLIASDQGDVRILDENNELRPISEAERSRLERLIRQT